MSKGSEPVFPRLEHEVHGANEAVVPKNGLTKRELMAAMMMQGALANSGLSVPRHYDGVQYKQIAQDSVKAADALLEALHPVLPPQGSCI